ncbi:MAG TPA: squalene/phytoene synthase family protein [Steroidobacteraceae bacterium]|nr:squalene/phytoene synthase family protein [Steroidobacteraceae bacterium]
MLARPECAGAQRYFAWLYSPARVRVVIESLFGIEEEIRAALRPGLEHRVAHLRLEWWREECARIAADRPVHPLGEALRGCRATEMAGLIDNAAWDLAGAPFATRAELDRYCARWADALVVPLARAGAAAEQRPAEEAATFARRAGAALCESELLAQLARAAEHGCARLPLDELAQAGVEPAALTRRPWPQQLAELVRAREGALRAALAGSLGALVPAAQPAARGLIVWAALTARASRRRESALPVPPAPHALRALADGWHAWRAARSAERGRGFEHLTETLA